MKLETQKAEICVSRDQSKVPRFLELILLQLLFQSRRYTYQAVYQARTYTVLISKVFLITVTKELVRPNNRQRIQTRLH